MSNWAMILLSKIILGVYACMHTNGDSKITLLANYQDYNSYFPWSSYISTSWCVLLVPLNHYFSFNHLFEHIFTLKIFYYEWHYLYKWTIYFL